MMTPLQAKSISNKQYNIVAFDDFAFLNADSRNTNTKQVFVSFPVMEDFKPMPVIPVNLKSDIQRWDKEINVVIKYLVFLLEIYTDLLKGASNNFLWVTFTRILPCTHKGTEADIPRPFLRQYDGKSFAAVFADVFNALRYLCVVHTSARTIQALPVGLLMRLDFECFSAMSARFFGSLSLTIVDTLRRTVNIICPIKSLATLWTRLINLCVFQVASMGAKLSNAKTIKAANHKRLSALGANCFRFLDFLAFPRTHVRAELAALFIRFERFTALFTNLEMGHDKPPSRLNLVCCFDWAA